MGVEGSVCTSGSGTSVASLAAMPRADLADNFEAFFNRTAEFFRHLSEVHWTTFGIALLCLLGMQLARAWAWRNVLRAAYPDKRIAYLPLAAAYLAGAGINAVVPAHAGDDGDRSRTPPILPSPPPSSSRPSSTPRSACS